MGTTLTPINFFSDEIKITPHTASCADHIGRPVSIREFASIMPVSLYRVEETNEYLVRGQGNLYTHFMEGPES